MHSNGSNALAVVIKHGYRKAVQARGVLLMIDAVASSCDAIKLGMKGIGVGDGLGRVGLVGQSLNKWVANAWVHKRQNHLATGAAVGRYSRAGLKVHTQWPVGLGTVKVDNFNAIKNGEVAGFIEVRNQPLQYGVPLRAYMTVSKRVDGQSI